MNPHTLALKILRQFEGCRLTAYRDPVGIWTIGYGHTSGVREGLHVTQEQAEAWLEEEADSCAQYIAHVTKVPLAENEMSALISLVYNIGKRAFERSTLLRKLNEGAPRREVANEFRRWNRAGGQILPGLSQRRKVERALFLDPQAALEVSLS